MNILKNKKVAIVGGGPGGLTLARILQMNGAHVNIYERDANKDVRVQGATLDLHEESGLKALQKAGIMDAFKANFRPGAEKLRIMDKGANILIDEHINGKDEIRRPEIDRGPLRKILLDSLQGGTVVWDSQFVTMSRQNNLWKLEFKNGTSALADIVIGADGANSKIRPYITDIKPFYTGVTAIEGSVYNSATASPKVHNLLKGGKLFAMGDSKSLIVSSKGDGSIQFYTSFIADENWVKDCGIDFSDKTQLLAWFRKDYAGWNDVWQELFENADANYIPRPIYSMPLDQTWESQPTLTILGDAAHLMTPFAGEGVNMAMLDAWELGKALTIDNHPDTLTAISAYEKQMRKRGAEAAKDSLMSQAELHSANALEFLMQVVG